MAVKLLLEGLGLGFLLYLICAIGIRRGAVGMVHLYSEAVQKHFIFSRLCNSVSVYLGRNGHNADKTVGKEFPGGCAGKSEAET